MATPRGALRSRPSRPGPEVAILRWPVDAGRRGELLHEAHPCLWLLEPGELVPDLERSEDWVRLPIDERDLHARLRRLAARAHGPGVLLPGEVAVDGEGLLVFGRRRVVVPAVEAALLDRLGEEPGRVVGRQELVDRAWGSRTSVGERALDSRLHTLRGRIAPLGLLVHTVRGRGFLLALDPRSEPEPSNAAVRGRPPARRSPWSNS